MTRRKLWPYIRWSLVLLLCVGGVYLLDWEAVLRSVRRLSIAWLAVILAVMTLDRVLMAWKWSLLLKALGIQLGLPVGLRICYQGSFVSSFFSVGGDVLRAECVARSVGRRSEAYASVLMERLIGVVSAVNLAALGAIVFVFTRAVHPSLGWGGLALAGVVVVNGSLVLSLNPRIHSYLCSIVRISDSSPLLAFARRGYHAYALFKWNRRVIFWNCLLTFGEQVLQTVILLMLAKALMMDVQPLTFLAASAGFYFLSKLPLAQDIWGLGEVSAIVVYGLIWLPAAEAFSMAMIFRGLQIVNVLPGWWFMSKMSESFLSSLQEKSDTSIRTTEGRGAGVGRLGGG